MRDAVGRGAAWAALALIVIVSACASGGSRQGGLLREDLGRQVVYRVNDAQIEYFGKHQILIRRRLIEDRQFLFESPWMVRDIPAEEVARGVFEARNRVILRGRFIERGLDPGLNIFRVTFEVENEVRTEELTDFHPAPFPDEVRARFMALYDDLNLELNTGIRR